MMHKQTRSISRIFLIVGIILGVGFVAGYQLAKNWSANGNAASILGSAIGLIPSNTKVPVDVNTLGDFETQVNKTWFLIGDEFSEDEQTINYIVKLTDDQVQVLKGHNFSFKYTVLGSSIEGVFDREGDTTHVAQINASDIGPGEYEIQAILEIESAQLVLGSDSFNVSYPLYVTWTIDWEGYDVSDTYLSDLAEVTSAHEDIPLTHFFNPRLYTNPTISDERRDYLTSWVLDRQEQYGESIGLHLHMFPDMVKTAGVTPIEDPIQWGSSLKDGYDIITLQYSYNDTRKMLAWAKTMFEERGLGTPVMFRAGGWYADEDTLKALVDEGFDLDSSGRTKYTFGDNNLEGPWDLTATTMPYQPNVTDQNRSYGPTFSLWEFPNNGADSWAFTQNELIGRFTDNYNQTVLTEPTVVTYLSHPEWFNHDKARMDGTLTYIDKYLYSSDQGPVIYTTLDAIYPVWASE